MIFKAWCRCLRVSNPLLPPCLLCRYVLDLIKMKETFIDKLIPLPADVRLSLLPDPLSPTWSRHSESTSSLTSPNIGFSKLGSRSVSRSETTAVDLDRLPIAAHFATSRSATPIGGLLPPLIIHQDVSNDHHPSSPPRSKVYEEEDLDATIRIKRTYHHLSRGQPSAEESGQPIDNKSYAHKSLPPLPLPPLPSRPPQDHAIRERISKRPISSQSLKPTISSESANPPDRWSRRFSATRKRSSTGGLATETAEFHSVNLPEDLRIVLEVTRDSILKGHIALSDALRKRYDDQYPLVRGLADIFIEHVGFCFQPLSVHPFTLIYLSPDVGPIVTFIPGVQQVRDTPGTSNTATGRLSNRL